MTINTQPTLETDKILLRPLKEDDFETLYAVASDSKIWEQHPNKNRYQREVFRNFFDGALQSKGAFCVVDKSTQQMIGSTRFYDFNPAEKSILIGYTFYGINQWGKGINPMVKSMMLDYIFDYVDEVILHIGADNVRSQVSISRLGATKIDELVVTYFGESGKLNYVYRITKNEWALFNSKVKV